MKKILFPTDFSEAAHNAFVYALHLADRLDARIVTLHVFRSPDIRALHMPRSLEEFYDTHDLYEFQSYRDEIPVLRKIAEENGFSHLEINHALERGEKVVKTILKVAERDEIDFIAMGTTGAGGLKKIFVGSVAAEVMENANCPVIVIPEKAKGTGGISQVAFTTNYKEEDKLAMRRLIEFCRPLNAHIHCINVDVSHTKFYRDKMEEFEKAFSDEPSIEFHVLEGTDIMGSISRYLEEKEIDLIATVIHKRDFFEELFSYSRSKELAYHYDTPVLSYQAHTLED